VFVPRATSLVVRARRKRALHWLPILVMPLAAPLVSCHSYETPSQQATQQTPPPPAYPAFPFDLPHVYDEGGLKMTRPNLVVFIDPSDDQAPDVTTALASLKTSGYWSAATSEYGVGPIETITYSTLAIPDKVTVEDLRALVAKTVAETRFPASAGAVATDDSGAPDGGADGGGDVDAGRLVPHTDVLYTVVLPHSTTLTDLSCGAVLAYHDSTLVDAVDEVPYAVIRGDCYASDETVPSLVHEIVEAATDPFPYEYPAFSGTGGRYVAWGFANALELADLCQGIPATSPDVPLGLTFPTVWSNRHAALGQNPCVPVDPSTRPVFAAAWAILPDVAPDTIASGAPYVRLAVGDSTTVDVRVASDGPADLTVYPFEVASARGDADPELSLSFDDGSAHDGDVRRLTIQRLRAPSMGPNGPHLQSRPTRELVSVFEIYAMQATGPGFATYGLVGMP
jgi:hypothetical protein